MTANALKICFICHKYPPTIGGGIGSVVQTTARMLVKMGHEVRVIGMPARDLSQPAYEEDEGVRVWRMYPGKSRLGYWGRLAWRRYQLFRRCAQWAKRGEIDLIEAPDYRRAFCWLASIEGSRDRAAPWNAYVPPQGHRLGCASSHVQVRGLGTAKGGFHYSAQPVCDRRDEKVVSGGSRKGDAALIQRCSRAAGARMSNTMPPALRNSSRLETEVSDERFLRRKAHLGSLSTFEV